MVKTQIFFKLRILAVLSAIILMSGLMASCIGNQKSEPAASDYRIIKDMWGREVKVRNDIKTAVIMEWEGLAAKSMKIFGLENNIIGVDNSAQKNIFRNHIVPVLGSVPAVGNPYSGVNYEQVAKLKPDIVFMELWVTNDTEKEMHETAIKKIEGFGIPVITFLSPSCYEKPDIKTAWEHIRLVGEVYNKQQEAEKLIKSLDNRLSLIKERTKDINKEEKANAVIYATENYVMGRKSIQSYFLTEILNANNLVADTSDFIKISEEQLLKYNPEMLVIIGHDGYLDTAAVLEGKHSGINWSNVKGLKAIENKRIVSLGYEEWRATIETPVGLLKIAKVLYPDRFEDIDIEAEELKMYMEDYNFSEAEALKAVEAQKFRSSLEIK
jgi:iron complex transport system substrate-binding protein